MKVLIAVDLQKDFIDGALGTPEARAIVPAAAEKIAGFDGLVAVTMDTHGPDYLDTREGGDLPVPHCLEGTPGWELDPAVRAALESRGTPWETFRKPTFGSAALGRRLAELARETPLEEIELIGLCTDICVISNAMVCRAFLPEVPIRVDPACCAGVTPASHETALAAMAACQVRIGAP